MTDTIDIWTSVGIDHRWRIDLRVGLFEVDFEPEPSYQPRGVEELLEQEVLHEYGAAIISRLGLCPFATTYLFKKQPWRVEFATEGVAVAFRDIVFRELMDEMSNAMLFVLWDFPQIRYRD